MCMQWRTQSFLSSCPWDVHLFPHRPKVKNAMLHLGFKTNSPPSCEVTNSNHAVDFLDMGWTRMGHFHFNRRKQKMGSGQVRAGLRPGRLEANLKTSKWSECGHVGMHVHGCVHMYNALTTFCYLMWVMWVCSWRVLVCTCHGLWNQRTTLWSWFSPSSSRVLLGLNSHCQACAVSTWLAEPVCRPKDWIVCLTLFLFV